MPFSQLTPQWVFSFICCGAYIIFPPPISAFFSAAPLLAAVLLCSAAPQLPQKLFAHIKFVTRVPKVAVFEDLGGKAGPIAILSAIPSLCISISVRRKIYVGLVYCSAASETLWRIAATSKSKLEMGWQYCPLPVREWASSARNNLGNLPRSLAS